MSSSSSEQLAAATRESLQALDAQRRSLEMEADAIADELTSPPAEGVEPMGIDTPLVDDEGYPRGDVDVHRARSLRNRLACIRTDHKSLMKDIERHLLQLSALQAPRLAEQERGEFAARIQPKPKPKYDPDTGKWVVKNWDGTVAGIPGGEQKSFDRLGAEQAENEKETKEPESVASASAAGGAAAMEVDGEGEAADDEASSAEALRNLRPFARVNSVADRSPAAEAGLREGDLILRFGNVDLSDNNSSTVHGGNDAMTAVGQLVPRIAAKNESVTVVVRRSAGDAGRAGSDQQQPSTVRLTPKPWSGRGLLGCHILPYDSSSTS